MGYEALIEEERKRQDEKWGIHDHHPGIWLIILMEEVGELAAAILYDQFGGKKHPTKDLEVELIQIAAVAKAMWESGKRNRWL